MGIAFVGTMCSTTSSVGVTQDGGRSLSSVASTAAHELGHVFNMNHDGRIEQYKSLQFHLAMHEFCSLGNHKRPFGKTN